MENNKSLRIRTNVGQDQYVTVNLTQEYDVLEILSMKIDQRGTYRYNVGDYGVVVGRVLANNGFGVPNAKLSLFIEKNDTNDIVKEVLYPYDTINGKDRDGRRYNLLPDLQKDDCHRVVGTFPNKRLMLDDTSVLEIFDEYYKYTTRTNEAGDYMFFGIPTGSYTLHMDLDISDCGKLSQRPRDFIYKGYTIEQFENPNQFKVDTELSTLSQVFSQDTTVDVKPFWGDAKEGTQIGITRKDIDVAFKFEPTCVFMGSIVTDTPNEGISRKCVPSKRMGEMSEMVTGPGTIEIIRKNIDNTVSELQIKGTQLIDGNGVWCFQIPMNLDYMMTDEYGNMVPTDNPEKGIPTRCEVRFRLSLDETNPDAVSYHRGKVLVPHNPNNENEIDYNFGSRTKDHSFKSLMWNNVYTIKSFIPRFQKARNILTDRFTGIKKVNVHGVNNPIPYNNIRIRIPFMFWLMCNIIKLMVRIVKVINTLKRGLMSVIGNLGFTTPYSYISNEICPDLEYWYFAPGMKVTPKTAKSNRTCQQWENESVCNTYKEIVADLDVDDNQTLQEPIYEWVDVLEKPNRPTYEYVFVDPNNNDKTLEVADVFTENELKIELGITGEITSGSKEYTIKYTKEGGSNWTVMKFTIIGKVENGVFRLTDDKLAINHPEYNENTEYVVIKQVDPTKISTKDNTSVEVQNMLDNKSNSVIGINLTNNTDYLMQCIEINLAQEYQVIKFDFYNDWLNGTVYLPRWARNVKYKKKRKKGQTIITEKVKACMNNTAISQVSRRYVQQCSLAYDSNNKITTKVGCHRKKLRCHKANGRDMIEVFGSKGGVVNESRTSLGDSVYYLKPCEFRGSNRVPFFATDIVMLGTLFDCNEYGLPSTFDSLLATTYQLPPNLAQTNVDDESDTYYNLNVTTQQQNAWGENTTWLAPSVDVIKQWGCNEKCPGNRWKHSGWGDGKGRMVTPYIQISGVTPTMPSYSQLDQYLATFDDSTDKGYGSYERIVEGDENTVKLKGAYILTTGGTYDNIDYNQYAWLKSHVSASDIIIVPTAATSGNTYFVPQGSILPPKKYENTTIKYVFYKNGFYEWVGGSVDDSEATTELTLAYEDIFPVTELSGIDWSYKGVGYDGLEYSGDKLLSPGGHFLGLSCSNAETNIKSCVNLKRACEIGTTLSERLEIPVGYKSGLESDEDLSYDIVNYLYVAPNGLISKDQINDVTFRSAFATMNQNSLRTVVNSYGYKEYDFKYLLPDSFDGSLEKKISGYTYTKYLPQETKSLWNESTFNELMESHPNLEVDVAFESGNTIVRKSEFGSNDYITFRMGDNKKYLYGGNRMPVYQNSFYFYFGLVNGSTALDLFKSQYYAPCAPQVITTPKGVMTFSVNWSSDDGSDDSNTRNFACDVDVEIRGLEMESVKNYTLTRLYMDDYHIIESEICDKDGELKNSGDYWTITGLRQATGIIQGQAASNNFKIKEVPIGTYEVHIQDEQGNEISQELEVGKGLLNVSYSKNSVVGYKTSVALTEMQTEKGATDETYNPKDAENGGYINGTFKITATDKSVNRYRVVVKRVSDYDSDVNPLNFELVYNGIGNYYPVSEWGEWKDGNRLYLWGYGEYEIWVRSIDMKTRTYSCEFKYDTFTVRDGSSLQFTIGDSSYGLGSVSYDTLYNLEKKGAWWTKFMSSTSDLDENERYLLYRTIVDYRNFNIGNGATPHNLNVVASPKDSNVLLLGEAYDSDKKLNKGVISSHGSVVTLTAEDEGLVLGTDNLYHALNETTSADTRSYPLYYTLYSEDGVTENNVWGTKYCEGRIVKEGDYNIFIANTDSIGVYSDFLNNVSNLKMFILEHNGDMMLVSCSKMSNRLYVVLGDEKTVLINRGKNIKEGPCKLVHVAKLPYWRNVFKYVGIVQRDKNTYLSSSDVKLVSNATSGYKVGIKQEGSFKIIVNDNPSLETVSSNDMYNNIVHMFTPKNNEFTTTCIEDEVKGTFKVTNREKVDGCDDYLVQISNSYLLTAGNTLHNILKTIDKDEFGEEEVTTKKRAYTVCQVFVSEKKNINGKVYYILKLN